MVWGTPRAAVGSSRMTSFGSPMVARATATDWRWPPDSEATGVRTSGIDTARRRSSTVASRSRLGSSMSRLTGTGSRPR